MEKRGNIRHIHLNFELEPVTATEIFRLLPNKKILMKHLITFKKI